MTTRMRVLRWIADNYDGWYLGGRTIWMIAEECQVAQSTVYRAVKALRIMGAVNEKKVYTGRQFVKPQEIAKYADVDRVLMLTEARYQQMRQELFATQGAIYAGIRFGLQRAHFEPMSGLPGIAFYRVSKQAVQS